MADLTHLSMHFVKNSFGSFLSFFEGTDAVFCFSWSHGPHGVDVPRLWYLPSSWASQFSVHVTQFWHAVSNDFLVAMHTMFMLTLTWFLGSKVTCEPSSYDYRTFLGLIGKMSAICTSYAFPELSVNLEIFLLLVGWSVFGNINCGNCGHFVGHFGPGNSSMWVLSCPWRQ
jgi:hypothetical protein